MNKTQNTAFLRTEDDLPDLQRTFDFFSKSLTASPMFMPSRSQITESQMSSSPAMSYVERKWVKRPRRKSIVLIENYETKSLEFSPNSSTEADTPSKPQTGTGFIYNFLMQANDQSDLLVS